MDDSTIVQPEQPVTVVELLSCLMRFQARFYQEVSSVASETFVCEK